MTDHTPTTLHREWLLLNRQKVKFWRKGKNEFFLSLVHPNKIFDDSVELCEMGDVIYIKQFRPVGIHDGEKLVAFALNFDPDGMQAGYRSLPFQFVNTMDVREASYYIATAFAMNNLEDKLVDQPGHPLTAILLKHIYTMQNTTLSSVLLEKKSRSGEFWDEGELKRYSFTYLGIPGGLIVEGSMGEIKIALRATIDPTDESLDIALAHNGELPSKFSFGNEKETWERAVAEFCQRHI